MIFIEHIHILEGICRIVLDSSLDICLLACHNIADESLPIEIYVGAPHLHN